MCGDSAHGWRDHCPLGVQFIVKREEHFPFPEAGSGTPGLNYHGNKNDWRMTTVVQKVMHL